MSPSHILKVINKNRVNCGTANCTDHWESLSRCLLRYNNAKARSDLGDKANKGRRANSLGKNLRIGKKPGCIDNLMG